MTYKRFIEYIKNEDGDIVLSKVIRGIFEPNEYDAQLPDGTFYRPDRKKDFSFYMRCIIWILYLSLFIIPIFYIYLKK